MKTQVLRSASSVLEDACSFNVNVFFADFKRSLPQFLQNPRVGKNDKTWKFNSAGTLHKRSDPKATDMWFGPRIGRSNEEPYGALPWAYVLLTGNYCKICSDVITLLGKTLFYERHWLYV